ncbi:MAG TPA: tRNA (adenosine(37)-N6)-threonylcarbamoyltransferase complex dimerization subunit type 1 TsaB [Actinoplanes sp.]|nr:tRNA (adenosine(37)-N6)-threonylcarbamoyltransferase complex dimerization subunit type 1 TsaB [Actinoplanes sp.]
MLVLVLDTSTPAVTAAVAEIRDADPAGPRAADQAGGAAVVRAERFVVDGRAHGELLAPQITAVLAEAGVRARDLTAIVAGVGPGPYTGLRVGLVTAASMGQVLGVPTYGVCSLDALGLAAGAGRVLAATDARRRELYWATYADGVRVGEPDVAKPVDLIGPGGVTGAVDRAVGEGAVQYADVLGRSHDESPAGIGLPVDNDLLYPPAWALATLAADRVRALAPGETLTPLYLRRPDAVEQASRKPASQPARR